MEDANNVQESQDFYNLEPRVPYPVGGKAVRLNSSAPIGPGLALAVSKGDTIRMSVKAYYEDGSGWGTNGISVANMASALTTAYGGLNGGNEGQQLIYDVFNVFAAGSVALGGSGNDNYPAAYLNYLVFDSDYNLTDSTGYVGMPQQGPGEYIMTAENLIITQSGFVYIYVSNESNSSQYVFFDNLDVAISESPILESSDYYPFGLTFNSYTKPGTTEQRWKFQGQEHISDLGLNWDQFKWRNADPALGRFFNVDPLAEKYVYNSPYAFSENKVVAHVELEGLEAWEIKYMRTEEQRTNVIPKAHQENFQAGYKIVGGIIATFLSAGAASPWLMAAGITSGMFSAASGTTELVANNMEGGTFTAADVPDSYLGALGAGADKLAGNENNQIEVAGNLVEGVYNLAAGAGKTSTAGVVNTLLNTTTVISSGNEVVENMGTNKANSNTKTNSTNTQNSTIGPPELEAPAPPILLDEP